jgi:pyruvate dehydrogenase E1 component alpha subunit
MSPPAAGSKKAKSQPLIHPAPKVLSVKTLIRREKDVLDMLGRDKLVGMFNKMMLIRAFEQRCEQMYQQRKIGGFLHLYIGQEAIAVGMLAAVREDDYVTTSYRDHGIGLALGISPNALMAEMFGKSTGVSSGKGGSMHFYSKEKNLLGGHGIVGGQIPVGAGAAFTARYREQDQVSLVFFGEGAMQQGAFHESANITSLWHLPCIFVVENNQYAMGTAIERTSSVSDLTLRAQGYNMEGVLVDGMNLLECYHVMHDVAEERRKNPGPALIEAKTYRYRGHSISDPANYRVKGELEAYQKVDPITQISGLLAELKWLDEAEAKTLQKEARQQAADSVIFADESPDPAPEERDTHVYAD